MTNKFEEVKGIGFKNFLPDASPECIDLLTSMLQYKVEDRISVKQALEHPYFNNLLNKSKNKKQESRGSNKPQPKMLKEYTPSMHNSYFPSIKKIKHKQMQKHALQSITSTKRHDKESKAFDTNTSFMEYNPEGNRLHFPKV